MYILVGPNPIVLNWRPAVQWYFPQRRAFSGFSMCVIVDGNDKKLIQRGGGNVQTFSKS